jgi:hypothetical protein
VCHHMWLQVFYLLKPAILRLTCTSYLESATFRVNRARWMVPCSSHFCYQHCKQMQTKWGLTSFTQGVGWSTKENQDSHKFENTTVSSDIHVYVQRITFYTIERYTQTSCFIHMYVHKCICLISYIKIYVYIAHAATFAQTYTHCRFCARVDGWLPVSREAYWVWRRQGLDS